MAFSAGDQKRFDVVDCGGICPAFRAGVARRLVVRSKKPARFRVRCGGDDIHARMA